MAIVTGVQNYLLNCWNDMHIEQQYYTVHLFTFVVVMQESDTFVAVMQESDTLVAVIHARVGYICSSHARVEYICSSHACKSRIHL